MSTTSDRFERAGAFMFVWVVLSLFVVPVVFLAAGRHAGLITLVVFMAPVVAFAIPFCIYVCALILRDAIRGEL